MRGLTVLRIVGRLRANSTDSSLSVEVSFGFIYNRSGDPTPDPEFDEFPWMYRQVTSQLPAEGVSNYFDLDIRTKRNIKDPQGNLLAVYKNQDTAQTAEFQLGVRILWGLP